jgi:hypothetical protein
MKSGDMDRREKSEEKNLRVNLCFLITRIQIFGRNVYSYLQVPYL